MDLLDYFLYSNIGFIFINALKDTFFFLSSLVLLPFLSDSIFFIYYYILKTSFIVYIYISILYILIFIKKIIKKFSY